MNNKLELIKEEREDITSAKREEELSKAMNKIERLQEEEREEFKKKLERLQTNFYAQHNLNFDNISDFLNNKLNTLAYNQEIEAKGFNRMLNDTTYGKSGIVLSPQMKQLTQNYLKSKGVKPIRKNANS